MFQQINDSFKQGTQECKEMKDNDKLVQNTIQISSYVLIHCRTCCLGALKHLFIRYTVALKVSGRSLKGILMAYNG